LKQKISQKRLGETLCGDSGWTGAFMGRPVAVEIVIFPKRQTRDCH